VPRYVVLARDFDFAEMARKAENDESPKHILGDVCDRLGATLVSPSSSRRPNVLWRLVFFVASRAYSTPQVWGIAHHVARKVKRGDLVYATGEDLGMTITVLCMLRFKRPALVVSVVWPERVAPTKLLLRFKNRIAMFLAVTEDKARQIRDLGGPQCPPVVVLPSVIDLNFFSVKPQPPRPVPLVVSAGLVDRDYVTLAKAVDELPIHVEVCAMSSMPASMASPAYPVYVPSNMMIGQQSLKELRDMYRASTLTVVPLVASNQGSGLTVVWEAMACGSPVLATNGAGDLTEYAQKGLVIGLPAEDPREMRLAIMRAIDDPVGMKAMAERARAFVEEHFNDERYVDILAKNLIAAQTGQTAAPESNATEVVLPIG
jgi:glycosyltransferase involved in cell wall biosynthesis